LSEYLRVATDTPLHSLTLAQVGITEKLSPLKGPDVCSAAARSKIPEITGWNGFATVPRPEEDDRLESRSHGTKITSQ
jgi:hypothetical protein